MRGHCIQSWMSHYWQVKYLITWCYWSPPMNSGCFSGCMKLILQAVSNLQSISNSSQSPFVVHFPEIPCFDKRNKMSNWVIQWSSNAQKSNKKQVFASDYDVFCSTDKKSKFKVSDFNICDEPYNINNEKYSFSLGLLPLFYPRWQLHLGRRLTWLTLLFLHQDNWNLMELGQTSWKSTSNQVWQSFLKCYQ